ncbi:Scr1 family TA system antitoxin-like transcriptional regulator [Nocardia carnea]|uniref:DUF397 domain-containing protein n=1 Tax=Nocardia carnea TaxID=37328 RepID=UPI003D78AB56
MSRPWPGWAKQLTIYQQDVVPGLFQIPDYARVIERMAIPDETEEMRDRRIQFKTRRQALITRQTKPVSADLVGVRDSKNPTGPALVFTPSEWDAFTATIQGSTPDRT